MPAIGTVTIANELILAPMANVLKFPFRLALKEMGFGLTGMGSVSAEAVVAQRGGEWINLIGAKEYTDERERPAMIQLIGDKPETMADAAELVESRCDVIDLNFGCPVPWVKKKGWGAAVFEDRGRAQKIIKAVTGRTRLPVSVKIRNARVRARLIDFVRACEDAGAAAITVHARTPQQGFQGPPRWEILPAVRAVIRIPLIGNGGVATAAQARTLIKEYGCDFVMVGRGAFHNPFAFQTRAISPVRGAWRNFGRLIAGHAKRRWYSPEIALAHFWVTRERVNFYCTRGFWI